MTFSLRDFCEPGDTYVNYVTGERTIIPTPGKDNAMKITYTIRDDARPELELLIDLEVDEEDDPDGLAPWADAENVDELLNWWSDLKGRGFLQLEDGYGIVVVDASSGEPNINIWSDVDDERYELEYFPFPSLSFEVTE